MPSPRRGMIHLNNNLICAIDCETTGNRPGFHDVWQVCFLPLDADLKPFKEIVPFYCDMQLKRPDNIDPEIYKKQKRGICAAQLNGLEPYFAADLFDEWYKKLNLGFNKKVIPLAQNWPFDRGFIIDWLGEESFEQYFSPLYRDTMCVSTFINDGQDHKNEEVPFPFHTLRWLTKRMQITLEKHHDALQDCIATAELYRQFCKRF